MKSIKAASEYSQALAKVHLATCGISYRDMDRPIIGIVNSWNEIVPGHVPLREVAEKVKAGVHKAGGLPIEFNTIAICDGITQGHCGMKYPLPSRELIADSIEAMVLGHGVFDGLVFITACDKITPGMLMASARLDLPSVFVTSGPVNTCGSTESKKRVRAEFRNGEISEEKLVEESLRFYTGAGVCPFLGTANTMLVVAEALGMMPSGTSLIPCGTAKRMFASQDAGEMLVELVRRNIRPSDIMTETAFRNAIRVVLAVGGSLNSLLHLPAIAAELDLVVGWDHFDILSKSVPFLTPVTPNGPYSTMDLYQAGGVPGVLKEIRDLLEPTGVSVNLQPLEDLLDRIENVDHEVIHSIHSPVHTEGGIAILYGTLAPDGAAVKKSAVPEKLLIFSGPARVFDSEEQCVQALENHDIAEGSVVVIRYEGPKGGPGMREMHRTTELGDKLKNIAIVTDGRFSGATAGLSVGYLCPEAYEGGPIALVQDGDIVLIDIEERRLDLMIDETELKRRKTLWQPMRKQAMTQFLELYRQTTSSAKDGARRRLRSVNGAQI